VPDDLAQSSGAGRLDGGQIRVLRRGVSTREGQEKHLPIGSVRILGGLAPAGAAEKKRQDNRSWEPQSLIHAEKKSTDHANPHDAAMMPGTRKADAAPDAAGLGTKNQYASSPSPDIEPISIRRPPERSRPSLHRDWQDTMLTP
jgi:hypothetical protein